MLPCRGPYARGASFVRLTDRVVECLQDARFFLPPVVHAGVKGLKTRFVSSHLPVLVMAVDLKEKIEAVVPKVNEMMGGHGLVTVERVEIVSPMPSSMVQGAEALA